MKKIRRYRLSIFISLFALIIFIHAPGRTTSVAANAQGDSFNSGEISSSRALTRNGWMPGAKKNFLDDL